MRGIALGVPIINKDHTILGLCWAPSISGNYHMGVLGMLGQVFPGWSCCGWVLGFGFRDEGLGFRV